MKKLDENETKVDCDSSIKTFVVNERNNLAIILLDNETIIVFDVALNKKIEHQNEMKYNPFEIIFIHLGALWLGTWTPQSNELLFNIQQINDFTLISCTSKLDTGGIQCTIEDFLVNRDLLLVVLKCMEQARFKIVQFQLLDSREIKQRNCFEVKTNNIDLVQCNWNNTLILFVTEQLIINIIYEERIIEFTLRTNYPIKSIQFDMENHFNFCVATDNHYHFYFFNARLTKCFCHDSLSRNSQTPMIAYKIPIIYVGQKENNISFIKCKQLINFEKNKEETEHLMSIDYDQLKKYIYDSKNQIKNEFLWRAAAKRCTEERDLDKAFVCIAKMGNVSLVRILKQQMAVSKDKINNKQNHLVLFLLMIHLDMIEESENFLQLMDERQIAELYRLQDKWTEAFKCNDNIELKNIYFQYGKQLEMENNISDAIVYYEKCGNTSQVVRMLFENDNLVELKNYCLKKQNDNGQMNNELVSWFGQYCESQSEYLAALEMYKLSEDYYNLVRILCQSGHVDQAVELVDEQLNYQPHYVNDKSILPDNLSLTLVGQDPVHHVGTLQPKLTAAVLFVAKHLESIDSILSIDYYLKCSAIRHAFRVSIANEHYDKMVDIVVEHFSSNEAQSILEKYFPDENDFRLKSVNEESMAMLYYKCQQTKRAILFSIQYRLWNFLRNLTEQELEKEERNFVLEQSELKLILDNLKEDTSLFDIVIDLILMSDQRHYDLITKLINQYGIELNDSLMGKLEAYISKHQNQALMNTIAELCLEKGNYQLAAKLFNKIGNRIDSIKALIRTGQADKIIQFANVARDKQVFKLAANFLQTINYEDTNLVEKFYTKADAHEELARYRNMLASINQQ